MLLSIVGLVLALIWLPELPDPVATHWGTHDVDGYGPAWVTILLIPVLGIGVSVLIGVGILSSASTRLRTAGAMGTFAPTIATFLVVLATGTLAVQRGLSVARDVGGIGGVALVGAIAAVVVGVIAWFALPADPPPATAAATVAFAQADDSTAAPTMQFAPGTCTTWTTVTSSPPLVIWPATVLALVPVVIVLFTPGAWSSVIITAVIPAIVLCMLSWRVTVDAKGLHVRALLGIPVFHIALDEITTAQSVDVDPLREFGGWGIRFGTAGRLGVVTRRGAAIEVERTNGRRLLVTTADAETGVALLNTLRDSPGA